MNDIKILSGITYIALIPLLPLASFILTGLFGRKYLKGSAGLVTPALIAFNDHRILCSIPVFFHGGKLNAVYQKIIPLKITWLEFFQRRFHWSWYHADPISVMMLVVVGTGFTDGAYLQPRLHERRRKISYLLCFPRVVYFFNAQPGGLKQFIPCIYVLGIGGCFVLPAHRVLLRQNWRRPVKSFHCNTFRRSRFSWLVYLAFVFWTFTRL